MKIGAILLTGLFVVASTSSVEAKSADAKPKAENPNFLSVCTYSHSGPNDPIVFPGQAGASHLHDFFGNVSTDQNSNLASLRRADTTCNRISDTSAYWVPALYENGAVRTPKKINAYYTLGGQKSVSPFPSDLKVITDTYSWACKSKDNVPKGSSTVPSCGEGEHLILRMKFPNCWDGSSLDSADHRSHLNFSSRRRCDSAHPVAVPKLTMVVHYPATGDRVTLAANAKPHADFFNAWDPEAQKALVDKCLNAGVHCGARGPNRWEHRT